MELTGSQILPVPLQVAWDALNDPQILKASITGCEELTRIGDTEFAAAVTAAIGPVKAKFRAKLTLLDVEAPNSYRIRFDGQGGVAGFGKGEARVSLTAEAEHTRLDYTAQASVGGKLAQIGSRLVDAAAKKMAEDFFAKFKAELAAHQTVAEPPPESPAATALVPPIEVAPVPQEFGGLSRNWVSILIAALLIAGISATVLYRS